MGVSIFFLKKVYAWDKKPAQVRTHGFGNDRKCLIGW
jgi:hypothetical protein